MTDWVRLIGGGFAHMEAPFALHSNDRDRAAIYRDEAEAADLEWEEVESHVDAYADKKRWSDDKRVEEKERVRKFMGM